MTTACIQMINSIPCFIPNTITDYKTHYVSYNDYDVGIYGDATTAIVVGQMQSFYILNGDHREQLSKLETLEEKLEYFKQNTNLKSKYSD